MRVRVREGMGDWSSMAKDQSSVYVFASIIGLHCDYQYTPSTSIACPDDREHSAPEVSIKNT